MSTVVDRRAEQMPYAEITEFAEKSFPAIWKHFANRIVNVPGNYYPYRAYITSSVLSAVEVVERVRKEQQGLNSNVLITTGLACKYDFPTYCISENLLRSLMLTHPPSDMVWSDVHFPYPSITVMLPRNTLCEPQETGGREIAYLTICTFKPSDDVQIVGTKQTLPLRELSCPKVCVRWGLGPNLVYSQESTFDASLSLEPDPSWLDAATKTDHPDMPSSKFSSYVAGIAANILLIMQERKDYVERGTVRVIRDGKRSITPHYIGRKYVLQQRARRDATGAHFTELGWRAGHWKTVPAGKGRQERKRLHIEPYIAFTRGLVKEDKAQ